jgi:hypothetical protein
MVRKNKKQVINIQNDLNMEKNNQSVDIKSLSKEQRAALMAQLQQEEKEDRIARRETYEALRGEFMQDVKSKVTSLVEDVKGFRGWLEKEADAFTKVMKEYGQVKSDEQRSYTITDGDFRLEVKSNKVKGFDERADMAADRLIDYLKRYMQNSEKGSDDPMYQMAMTLLERNKMGDLDYKSISKLYELEDKFDEEYADIMRLFKRAITDCESEVRYDPEHKKGVSNLMTIYSAATGRTFAEIEAEFAGRGYGDFKKTVGEAVVELLRPIREESQRLLADKAYLQSVCESGAQKAAYVAEKTLRKVYKKVGFVAR